MDIPVVAQRQIPIVQIGETVKATWSRAQTSESLGTCTSSPGGISGNCGVDRDRRGSTDRIRATQVRHGTCLGVSASCCGVCPARSRCGVCDRPHPSSTRLQRHRSYVAPITSGINSLPNCDSADHPKIAVHRQGRRHLCRDTKADALRS